MLHRHGFLAVLMCSTVGCASSYVPRPSPRVSLVMEPCNPRVQRRPHGDDGAPMTAPRLAGGPVKSVAAWLMAMT